MLPRRLLLGAAIFCVLVGVLGVLISIQQRVDRCAYVPLLADELLPNANLSAPGDVPGLPAGWARAAGGVQLRGPAVDGEGFELDGDGRALQLIGIANYVQTPPIPVAPGRRYCFSGSALTDSPLGSTARARLVFRWADADGQALPEATTGWQPVRLWTPATRNWSPLQGSAVAPAGAASLAVRVEPASDDRIYLDAMHVRRGGDALIEDHFADVYVPFDFPRVNSWPGGRRAAVAFTFDWETAMGGLVHSRSVGDPNFDKDPLARGLRMREGITTTVAIFQQYDVRATYFATGYNFLLGNPERRLFMNDPTFAWATKANGWVSERWTTTPWFADDPYGTIQSDPAWYFGDLVPQLLGAGHEIQSHTFSHFFGGYVDAATWQADLTTWDAVAAERGVPPARAIAFPWSSSSGISDSDWDAIEAAGVSAVTRLSDQAQYNLFPVDGSGLVADSRCRWLPGREGRILACPDFYLKPDRADLAIQQIARAVAQGGMIDIWAHTEEVTSPAQIAAWTQVVRYAAEDPAVWVAPFTQIADWQRGVEQVQIHLLSDGVYEVRNRSQLDLAGLSIELPPGARRASLSGDDLAISDGRVTIDLGAGQSAELRMLN
ncbi:polysaccharide deacetylase family protein [Oscillochloris sp. ZM17-4]|uniref:polysaccharide deacetylase family protein n=1 Tax=Oscillochloris sp. ZM17-4 TaxID=2866714 RepID=UPI001C72BD29|nr:polysaccharide deacetylase family protein [Oscillochloris sp. ZM17-4]MBX0327337.1 polysaccharide deacetylase family protein [Oscillochloris sp. ZM17-4]